MSQRQSNGFFVKIAVFIVGLALPLSIAAPASAAVTTSRAVEQELAALELSVEELRQRFAEVDPQLVDELNHQLSELRSYGLELQDLAALSRGETVNGVNPSLLGGLLATILELVYSLLESLGLADALPDLPDLPDIPDLPTVQQVQGLGLLGGGLVDDLLGQVGAVSDGLGLTDEPVGLNVLQDLIDTLLAMIFDLLLSLGLIDLPDLPDLPDIPDVPDVPAGGTDGSSSPIKIVISG